MIDRRAFDPYAPHMPPVPAPEPEPQPQPSATMDPAGLENLTKTELIIRAEHYGLPIYGTKADLIERLTQVA